VNDTMARPKALTRYKESSKNKGGYTVGNYDYVHMGIKPEAVPAQRILHSAMEALADEGLYTKCYGNSYWYTDYDGRGFEDENGNGAMRNLTVDECEELCSGCPLLKVCYDFAVANDEKYGIWGGINFGADYDALFDMEDD
jgi:hypothetical protein